MLAVSAPAASSAGITQTQPPFRSVPSVSSAAAMCNAAGTAASGLLPASKALKLITVPKQLTQNRPADITDRVSRTDACGQLRRDSQFSGCASDSGRRLHHLQKDAT